jgi:hypothetical protein
MNKCENVRRLGKIELSVAQNFIAKFMASAVFINLSHRFFVIITTNRLISVGNDT